ncbi:MAG: hypothetical protein K5924_10815 [Chloroflexi bacterium]|nr:hypothetical protein [Chloroflexota bacterium]
MTKLADVHPLPDGIDQAHVLPVAGWRRHASPLGLVIFTIVLALALFGVMGRERTWAASGGGVGLHVHGPEVIRNGEFFELRITVRADEPVDELVIGVEESLWEDVTVNTMIPAAADEASENGEARFTFAELAAGDELLLKIDLQVNPDIIAGNEGAVTVYDGDEELTSADLTITVLP